MRSKMGRCVQDLQLGRKTYFCIFHRSSTDGTHQKEVSIGWLPARLELHIRDQLRWLQKMAVRLRKADGLNHDLQSTLDRTASELELLEIKSRITTMLVSSSPERIQVTRNFSVVEHTFMLSEHKFCERSQSFSLRLVRVLWCVIYSSDFCNEKIILWDSSS